MFRPIEASFLFLVIVLWATYSGNLTATFAAKRGQWPFQDIKGLADADDYDFLFDEHTDIAEMLKVYNIKTKCLCDCPFH